MFSVQRLAWAAAAVVAALLIAPRDAFARRSSTTEVFCATMLADVEADLRDLVKRTEFDPEAVASEQELLLLATAVVRLSPPARLGTALHARGRYREPVWAFREVGGQIQRVRGGTSSFIVRPDGTPILRLAKEDHFAHEWDHFAWWRDVRGGFILSGFEPEVANVAAFALMLTPQGMVHAEARAALVDLKALGAQRMPRDTDLATLLQLQSIPYLSGLRTTATMLHEARRFEIGRSETLLVQHWDKLLDNFVEGFDAFQDRVRDYFAPQVRRRSIGEWDRELREWLSVRGSDAANDYRELPDDLRAYAIYRRATSAQRRDRLIEIAAESQFLNEIVRAVERRRRERP